MDYINFNMQHRQGWPIANPSPLLIDLADDYNQHLLFNFAVNDSISGVPIPSIERIGAFSNNVFDFVTNTAPLVGVYFTQTQLDAMLAYYSSYYY